MKTSYRPRRKSQPACMPGTMYWIVPSAGGAAPFPSATSCLTNSGRGRSFRAKSPPAQKPARSEPIAVHATSGIQSSCRQRATSGSSGSEYLLHAPRRDIPNLSATTAARMGGPPRRPPRGTASARGLPRRRPPARRKACRSGSAQPAVRRRQNRLPRRITNSAHGLLRRSLPVWRPASKSGSVHNAV